MTVYHDVGVKLLRPATVLVRDGTLSVQAGQWPTEGDPVELADLEVALAPEDAAVLVDRQGGIVLAPTILPYGLAADDTPNELLDLLAWFTGDEWHVLRLVPHA